MQQTKPDKKNFHLWANKTPDNSQVVGVHWVDIVDISNWNEDEFVVEPARGQYSLGYLLYEGPNPQDPEHDMTVIAVAYDTIQKRWSSYTVFPSEVVRTIVAITRKRKK